MGRAAWHWRLEISFTHCENWEMISNFSGATFLWQRVALSQNNSISAKILFGIRNLQPYKVKKMSAQIFQGEMPRVARVATKDPH